MAILVDDELGATVREILTVEHNAVPESISPVRVKRIGSEAVVAVTFGDRTGRMRLALVGATRDVSGSWDPTGAYVGTERPAQAGSSWTASGGWSSGEITSEGVFGGWVADRSAAQVRLRDASGRAVTETVEDGVAIFHWVSGTDLSRSEAELLADDGRVIAEARR